MGDEELYRCEKCDKVYGEYQPVLMINVKVSDATDSLFVTFAGSHGEALLGMTAKAFESRYDEWSDDELHDFLDQLSFKPLRLTIRGRLESFMGENKMKFYALKVEPQDGPNGLSNLQKHNRDLMDKLKIYN